MHVPPLGAYLFFGAILFSALLSSCLTLNRLAVILLVSGQPNYWEMNSSSFWIKSRNNDMTRMRGTQHRSLGVYHTVPLLVAGCTDCARTS